MTPIARLALIRHGHTEWNRMGKIQGRSDIALDESARAELAVQMLPSPWDRAELWSSPLMRADETARLIADRAPRHADALIEMNWGDWEGQHGKTLRADASSGYLDIEDWGWEYQPPNGETPAQLRDRLLPWARGLRGDAVAVCHIGIMRVLMAAATGWDFRGPAPFRIKRNRLFVIDIDADGTLHACGDPVRLIPRKG